MAKYAISRKGIEALEELKDTLAGTSEKITMISEDLINVINGLENELGVYYKEILVLTRNILVTIKESEEELSVLTNTSIPNKIKDIEDLINMGLGDEDDEPPQKKLVLRR